MTRLLAVLIVGVASLAQAGLALQPEKPAAQADATSCTLEPKFKVGRRLVYTFRTVTTIFRQAPDAQEPAPAAVYTSEITIRLAALGVDEHGGASMVMLIDHAKLSHKDAESELVEGEYSRDVAEKTEALPEDAPLPKRLALALARSVGRIDVGPDGVVTTVDGLDDAQALAKEHGAHGGHLLGPLAANADRRTLSMLFRADTRNDADEFPQRKPGDTWELIDRIPIDDATELVLTTNLEMDACSAEEAKASGAVRTSVEAQLDEKGQPMPTDPGRPKLEVAEQSDTLTLIWNPALGALKKRQRDSRLSVAARLGTERRAVHTMETKSTIELVETADP